MIGVKELLNHKFTVYSLEFEVIKVESVQGLTDFSNLIRGLVWNESHKLYKHFGFKEGLLESLSELEDFIRDCYERSFIPYE